MLQSGEITEQIEQRAPAVFPLQFSVLSQIENSQVGHVTECLLLDVQEVVVVFYGNAPDGVIAKHLVRDGLETSFVEDQA